MYRIRHGPTSRWLGLIAKFVDQGRRIAYAEHDGVAFRGGNAGDAGAVGDVEQGFHAVAQGEPTGGVARQAGAHGAAGGLMIGVGVEVGDDGFVELEGLERDQAAIEIALETQAFVGDGEAHVLHRPREPDHQHDAS